MIRATRKILLRKELKTYHPEPLFYFNDIKLRQFQVIHSLFPASLIFK